MIAFLRILLLLFVLSVSGREIHVPRDVGNLTAAASLVQDNDTLVLDPTQAPFDCGAEFFNFTSITVRSLVRDQRALLNCQGRQRGLTFVNVTRFTLVDLGVTGGSSDTGGAVFALGGQINATIEGCWFWNNTALSGGALHFEAKASVIVEADGCRVENNVAYQFGGAIAVIFSGDVTGSSLRMMVGSTLLSRNIVLARTWGGGAVFIGFAGSSTATVVEVIGGMYANNTAVVGGGAISVTYGRSSRDTLRLTGGVFDSNSCAYYGHGGAVWIFYSSQCRESSVTVQEGAYRNNLSGAGGAIFVHYGGESLNNTVQISNGTYISNAVPFFGSGGAVWIVCTSWSSNNLVIVEGGTFVDNISARGGGAIAVAYRSSTNDTARVLGGVYHSNIGQNADNGGGAIQVLYDSESRNSSLSVESGTFEENTSVAGGAAISVIYIAASFSNIVRILDGVFCRNAAPVSPQGGGAIEVYHKVSSSNSSVFVGNSSFTNNTSGGGGGAILVMNIKESLGDVVRVSGSDFVSNTATGRDRGGGAIEVHHNAESIMGSVVVDGVKFTNNTSEGGGGAVFIFFVGQARGNSLQVRGALFTSNRAISYEGGAIFVFSLQPSNRFSLSIDRTVFLSNSVQTYLPGGAVCVLFRNSSAVTDIRISRSDFHSNEGSDGGAVSLSVLDDAQFFNIEVESCFFRSNTASRSGGAVSVRVLGTGSNVSAAVANCSFSGNSAQGPDGATLSISMPTDESPSRCHVCTTDNNNINHPPSDCGYGLNVTNATSLYCEQGISASLMVRNVFAPYVYSNSVNVSDCSFVSNSVPNGRGIVFLRNGDVTLAGQINFANNTGSSGAGLVLDGSARLTMQSQSEVRFVDSVVSSVSNADSGAAILSTSTGELRLEGALLAVQYADSSATLLDFGVISVSRSARARVSPSTMVNVSCPPGYQLETASADGVSVFSQSTQFFNEFSLMLLTNVVQLSCSPCGPSTYLTTAGYLAGGVNGSEPQRGTPNLALDVLQAQPRCEKCPLGLVCSGSNSVMIEKDYWGTIDSESGVWQMTRCAAGYCCQSASGCAPGSTEACAVGRDWQAPLCGACLAGYSKDLRGPGCTLSGECGHWEWYWPFVIVLGVGYGTFVVYSAASDRRVGSGWEIASVSFFAQNAQLVLSAANTGLSAGRVVDAVHVVFGLSTASPTASASRPGSLETTVARLASYFNTVCALPGITTDSAAIALQLVTPGIVFATVGALFGAGTVVAQRRRRRGGVEPQQKSYSRLWEIAVGSGLSAAQFLYTKMSTVTFELLHCVSVGGEDGRRMLLEGAVRCGSRQWLVAIVAGLPVVLFPVALMGWHRRARKRCGATQWAERPVALRALEGPYREEMWFWGSLTLCRRLVVSLVATFAVGDLSVQGILFAVLFGLFGLLQAFASPFVERVANLTESVSLVVLLFISVCGIRTGSFAVVEVDVGQSEYGAVLRAGEELIVVQTVLFFVPIVMGIVFGMLGRRERILVTCKKLHAKMRGSKESEAMGIALELRTV